ncbi:hypothetical protein BH09MYX1_BH09MYX1_11170 [soil metagenome]
MNPKDAAARRHDRLAFLCEVFSRAVRRGCLALTLCACGTAVQVSQQATGPQAGGVHRESPSRCRADRAYVSAGAVSLSFEKLDLSFTEPLRYTVVVDVGAFCMDRTEVTREAFGACVKAGECKLDAADLATGRSYLYRGHPNCLLVLEDTAKMRHPAVCVNLIEARAFCRARLGRIPSEAEWYRAAQGLAVLDEPSANEFDVAWQSEDGGRTWPVGTHSDDVSQSGVADLIGNVGEWTFSTTYPGVPRSVSERAQWAGWFRERVAGQPEHFRTRTRATAADPDARLPNVGFRCVYPFE